MHRQSLGSPSSSKLVKDEQLTKSHENTHKKQSPAQSSSSGTTKSISKNLSGLLFTEQCMEQEEEELKKKKKIVRNSSTPETYIHLIPMLTLLCFLILYLSSHNPSQSDLAQFNGFKTFSNPSVLEDSISELERVVEIKKGDILAVRSLKNLKPEEAAAAATAKQRRLHRKMARS